MWKLWSSGWRRRERCVSQRAESALTRKIEEAVGRARRNEEWRAEYMKELLHDDDVREEGRQDGYDAGIREGIETGRAVGIREGIETGRAAAIHTMVKNLAKQNLPIQQIAEAAGVDEATVREWIAEK